jgi:hypothetical protein
MEFQFRKNSVQSKEPRVYKGAYPGRQDGNPSPLVQFTHYWTMSFQLPK